MAALAAALAGFSGPGRPTILPQTARFIDIGVNLLDSQYQGIYNDKSKHPADVYEVLERAKSCGVVKNIVTAGTLAESHEALAFVRDAAASKGFDQLFTTVGVHPTRASDLGGSDAALVAQLMAGLRACIADGKADGRVVALGECGLDYDRLHFCTKEAQQVGFALQLDLAAEARLPLFLHNRNTGGDFLRTVEANIGKIPCGGVVHSFDGDIEEMLALCALGLHIGINGCSLKTEENLAMVREIPLDRLMLETDAPWCGIKPSHAGSKFLKSVFPRQKNDKFQPGWGMVKDRNEPCTMVSVLEVVAAARDCDPIELADAVYANTEKLFFP
jgi:TatD DNase family protein